MCAMKRPIDVARDAAMSMEVGDATDTSSISEAVSLRDRLLIAKEQGIWQIHLADDIDPARTNERIPNTQQKLIARGSSDVLVGRTLLQAKRLLKKAMLPADFPVEGGLSVTMEFLIEIDALESKREDLNKRLLELNKTFEHLQSKRGTLQVPALGDASSRGKAFVQAADHA